MANFVIDANSSGSFQTNTAANGENDTVTVNIGINFRGTISVNSSINDNEIEIVTVNIPEGWSIQLVGETPVGPETPQSVIRDYNVMNTTGAAVGSMRITSNNQSAICFAAGTLIETKCGYKTVETLKAGDYVRTRAGSFRPIKWIGFRFIRQSAMARFPSLRPIRIKANSLGEAYPFQDLIVSRHHRILIQNRIVERMFETPAVLVEAHRLTWHQGIDAICPSEDMKLYHILLDSHDVIYANGMQSETLNLGPMSFKALDPIARGDVARLFPNFSRDHNKGYEKPFIIPSLKQQNKLCERIEYNAQALFDVTKPLSTPII